MPLPKAVVGLIYWLVYVNREAFFTLVKKVGYPPIIRILIPAVHKNTPAVVCAVCTPLSTSVRQQWCVLCTHFAIGKGVKLAVLWPLSEYASPYC